jgi:hypothetical protein
MRTSASGSRYLTGRLSNARVLVMENRDRNDDASHVLLIAEANKNWKGGAAREHGEATFGQSEGRGHGGHAAPTSVPPALMGFRPPPPDRLVCASCGVVGRAT